MGTTITLNANADYGQSGQYIARITGRAPRVQFAREFVGSKSGKRNDVTSYETDECGLYEVNDATRKGKVRKYLLVLPWRDELVKLTSDHEDALTIAKRLDGGEGLEDIVSIEREPMTKTATHRVCTVCRERIDSHCSAHPEAAGTIVSEDVPVLDDLGVPRDRLVYVIRSKGEAKRATAAATLDSAVDAIVNALQALPAPQQKQALKAARDRLFPKASDGEGGES
jgi:hypothetical protein